MLPGPTTMPDWLRQRASTTPDRLALKTTRDWLTFRQLDEAVDGAARGLIASGAAQGRHVALLAGNGAGFPIAVHAAARAGAVLVPLNVRLSLPEIAWQLQDASVTLLVHDEAHADAALAATNELAGLRAVSLQSLVASAAAEFSADPRPPHDFDLDDVATIVYTSGTTGRPKGAMLSFGNHLWSAVGSALNLGVRPDDRWLAILPLFHVGGLAILWRSVLYGVPALVHESFDPERVNRAIDEDGVTCVSVVAAMLSRMLDVRGDRPYPPSLRCVLLGGGPAPEPLLQRCAGLGVPVVQTYGLTETASQVATLAPEDALPRLSSAGKPLFGSRLRIVRDDGSECDSGKAGEIAVQGATVTRGYYNNPEATAAALRDGWLHTGDAGYLDAEGYLYVLDRRDDLIISGGENVYPAEVEAVLQAHAGVLEAGVRGVADERWGQRPVAFVVRREDARPSEEQLLAHCRERLASYKTPVRVHFVASLPRNAAGKLVRRELSPHPSSPSPCRERG